MSYSLERFIKPVVETDKIVTIYNNLNIPTYSINPFSVLRVYVTDNLLKVTLNKLSVIILDFKTNDEAKKALYNLQAQFDYIKRKAIKEAQVKEEAISQVTSSVDFSQIYNTISTGGTYSGPTSSGTASTTIEQKLITFVQTLSQDITNINNNVSSGTDFIQLYSNAKSGNVGLTASSTEDLDSRLSKFINSISQDIYNLNNKTQVKVNEFFNPISLFSQDIDEPKDVLDVVFDFQSLGMVNVYINGVGITVGDSMDSTIFFSDENLVDITKSFNKKNRSLSGYRLFINPYLLGYDIDPTDVISIEYIKEVILS